MQSVIEQEDIRKMINSFFKFSGTPPSWNGAVNEEVARVFAVMLSETAKCSKALKLLPTPFFGALSKCSALLQLSGFAYRNLESNLSVSCAKTAIRNWRSEFDMASQGIASTAAKYSRWS